MSFFNLYLLIKMSAGGPCVQFLMNRFRSKTHIVVNIRSASPRTLLYSYPYLIRCLFYRKQSPVFTPPLCVLTTRCTGCTLCQTGAFWLRSRSRFKGFRGFNETCYSAPTPFSSLMKDTASPISQRAINHSGAHRFKIIRWVTCNTNNAGKKDGPFGVSDMVPTAVVCQFLHGVGDLV